MRFQSCVKCMPLFLPYRSVPVPPSVCAKACENTIEVHDGAGEARRIIALVSRTQNTSNSDERISNRFICTFILSSLKCVIVVQLYVYVHHSLSFARKNDRDNFR